MTELPMMAQKALEQMLANARRQAAEAMRNQCEALNPLSKYKFATSYNKGYKAAVLDFKAAIRALEVTDCRYCDDKGCPECMGVKL